MRRGYVCEFVLCVLGPCDVGFRCILGYAVLAVDLAARTLDPAARPLDPAARPLDPAVYKQDPAVAVHGVML